MSFNLMDLIKDQLSDQVMGQLGNVLGGNASQNTLAISSAIPGILSGLINTGSSDKGAGSLFNTINDQDDSILDNLGDLLGGDNQSSMMEMGTKALGGLLGGGGLGSLVSAVSGFSGANKSKTSSLIGLLAPILFGVVKRKLLGGGGGFDVNSLMSMFNGQKDNVKAAMPSGFSDALKSSGFDTIDMNLTKKAEAAADNAMHNTREVATEGKSMMAKILPWAVLVGAALIAYNLFFNKSTTEDTGSTSTSTSQVATPTQTPVETPTPTSVESTTTIQVDTSSLDLGKELTSTLDTLTTSFGSITDGASATAALPNLTTATDKLGGIADMMNKLPDAAKGPIKQIVSAGMPKLQELMDKISEIPGVGGIIEPVLDSLSAKMEMFE